MPFRRVFLAAFLTMTAVACSSGGAPAGSSGSRATASGGDATSSPQPPSTATDGGSPGVPPAASASPLPGSAPVSKAAPPAGIAIPAAGTYQYDQHGQESYCTGSACGSPQPLPPRMTATLTHAGGGGLTLEMKISDGRLIRAALDYERTQITLTSLYVQFTEQGVTQSATVNPAPPIVLMKPQAQPGSTWSAKFADGDVHGTYRFSQRQGSTIRAAGAARAARVTSGQVVVDGDNGGTVGLTLWTDPATNVLLRISADLNLHSGAIGYKGSFTDTLARGPQA